MSAGNKILVVDDEKDIADIIGMYLEKDNFTVVKCNDGQSAMKEVENNIFDLAILDVMLPDVDGFSILKRIRESYPYPVIMLTAKVSSEDKIYGLTLGADDYITKPFNPLELVARVRAQIRRSQKYNVSENAENVIDFAGVVLNKESRICNVDNVDVILTPIEFDIIWLLCENKGNVVTSEEIYNTVWKEKQFKNNNNTVMVHIRHIREKIEEISGRRDFIKTVWGVGYRVDE